MKAKHLSYFLHCFLLSVVFQLVITITAFSQNYAIDSLKLDSIITTAMQQWRIPGMAVGIIHNNQVVFANGYGVKEFGKKEKVDGNTLFQIASNTKAFTACALGILVDRGLISWDDKVIDYLPYFQLYDPYVTNEMTIRDCLTHRSGLGTFSGDLLWYKTTYSREEIIRRARYLKPEFSFRSDFGYSNLMYLTAGEIIPVVTGKSWDDFIRNEFFIPLEMKNSNTSITKFAGNKNVAQAHLVEPEEEPIVIQHCNWDNAAPAAAINSSINDMLKWIKFQLNNGIWNGDTILNPDIIWETRAAQNPQYLSKNAATFYKRQFSAYALGWSTYDFNGFKVIEHGGGSDGMISKVAMIPSQGLGFVILTNSINYLPDALMYHILDQYFNTENYNWSSDFYQYFHYRSLEQKKERIEAAENRKKETQPSLDLQAYTGLYGGDLYGNAEVTIENGKLVVSLLPAPELVGDLSHWHFDTFEIKLRNSPSLPTGTVNFILDINGKVEEMRIDIPNPDFFFTELEFKKLN